MALTNTKERYGKVAQFFHWLTALLILGLLVVGTLMNYLPETTSDQIARKVFVFSMHKTLGVLVLIIALLRIVWAFANPRPLPLHPERKMETFAAEAAHWVLYIAIVAMPVTGLLYHASSTGFAPIWWPFGQELPFVTQDEGLAKIFSSLHWILALGVTLTLIAHIGGALKHLIIDRDETIARMVPNGLSDNFALPHADKKHLPNWLAAVAAILVITIGLGAVGFNVSVQNQAQTSENTPLTIEANTAKNAKFPWEVIAGESSLKISVKQLGSPVEGEFMNWNAQINFDPDNLEASSVDARIDIASLQIGSVSDQAKSSDFLNADEHAQARFLSDSFQRADDGNYQAVGTLEIAGVTKPFVLSFTLNIQEGRAHMQANAVVNRMEYEIGAQKYANEDSVAYPVEIMIDLIAEKQW